MSILRILGFFTEPLLKDAEIHRVIGEPSRIVERVDDRDVLKIVTWNIERGTKYDAILDALRRLDGDVVLLQEVDWNCRRTSFRHVPSELAAALNMNWVAAGEFQEIGESRANTAAITGQAILSRFPIQDAEALRFAAQDRWRWAINPVQPRRGGRIALKARTAGMVVYNAHIESGDNDSLQRRQIEEILTDQSRHPAHQMPVLIAGDFNNGPIVQSAMFGHLSAADFADALGESRGRGPTSLGRKHPIDWIFVKNVKPLTGRIVGQNGPPASDHFPVTADLDLESVVLFSSR